MKRKTIKKIIAGKLHKLVESIPAHETTVRDILKNHVIVTGGCIPSMFLDEEVNDFDLYFDSWNHALIVAKYYMDMLKGSIYYETMNNGFQLETRGASEVVSTEIDHTWYEQRPNGRFELGYGEDGRSGAVAPKADYSPIFVSPNAITLANKVQLVFRFFGTPEEIHSTYDFVHCTNYFYKGEIVVNVEALEALLTKELVYTGSQYPLCSIIRTRKFVKRGWKIHAGHFLKMAMQLNELDLKDIPTLRDQLVGVDSAYFSMLISRLESDGGDITTDMICDMVDQIFN